MLWGVLPSFGFDAIKNPLSFPEACRQGIVEPAEMRAAELLRRFLPAGVFDKYCYSGEILAIGQLTGRQYIIRRKETILELSADGAPIFQHCIHISWGDQVPDNDNVLAQWLTITANEKLFLEKANRSPSANRAHSGSWFWGEQLSYAQAFREFLFDELINKGQFEEAFQRPDVIRWDDDLFEYPENFHIQPINGTNGTKYDQLELILDQQRARWEVEREERRNRLAYDVGLGSSKFWDYVYKSFDDGNGSWLPTVDPDNQTIMPGMSCLCLLGHRLKPHSDDVSVTVGDKKKPIFIRQWNSHRDIDDIFLYLCLSAYTESRNPLMGTAPQERVTQEWHEFTDPFSDEMGDKPAEATLIKCIMSSLTYRQITGDPCRRPIYPMYDGKRVIIDDRAGHYIFLLPRSEELGYLTYTPRTLEDYKTPMTAGMIITKPQNVIVRTYWRGQLGLPSMEGCIEALYSRFPFSSFEDGMKYDMITQHGPHYPPASQSDIVNVSSLLPPWISPLTEQTTPI